MPPKAQCPFRRDQSILCQSIVKHGKDGADVHLDGIWPPGGLDEEKAKPLHCVCIGKGMQGPAGFAVRWQLPRERGSLDLEVPCSRCIWSKQRSHHSSINIVTRVQASNVY